MNIKTHSSITLPLVLYESETWFPVLREKDELRLCENRALRKMFEPKTEKVTEGCEGFINEKLHDFNLSTNIRIKDDKMGGI
jgi:hypothetical protein